ncbi:MAG: divergent polysaccharide deacetylase family protein [Pseudomonadota bacterium]
MNAPVVRRWPRWRQVLVLALTAAALTAAALPAAAAPRAELAVVVDDLGHHPEAARRTLTLPDEVAIAILPFAPATQEILREERITDHELLLHQPMEPLNARAPLAPGTLTRSMPPPFFSLALQAALQAVPGIVGVSNHTGSRLTSDAVAMERLMQWLAGRNLLFLDSRTTPDTVAYTLAREAGIAAVERDVFLDHDPAPEAMAEAFRRALRIAREQGHAVVIAHPHADSLAFLQEALARLPEDVALVPLTRLVSPRCPAASDPCESPGSRHRSLGQ